MGLTRTATCHPERKHFAKGKCSLCYHREKQAEYVRRDPQRNRTIRRRSKYGIEPEQYAAMVAAQEARCFICANVKPLCIDHCHETGTVRALLCKFCNMVIGFAEADPTFMSRLGVYVLEAASLRAEAKAVRKGRTVE